MAQRKATFRVDTEAVQGAGSFAEIRSMTAGEHLRYRSEGKVDGYDWYSHSLQVLREHVVTWDWVDEDGTPLPLPSADPTVIERLTDPEIELLSVAVLRGPTALAKAEPAKAG